MSEKNIKTPDSDISARGPFDDGDDRTAAEVEDQSGAQTSVKAGKHSTVEKLAASRPQFGRGVQSTPVDGAFGDEAEDDRPAGTPGSEGLNGRQGGVSDKARNVGKKS